MTHFLSQTVADADHPDPLGGRLWTPEEVAGHLRVAKETLREWRRLDQGPPVVMVGLHTPRYPENGLMMFIRHNATVTIPAPRRALAS
jgi:hypothetical protein